MFLSCLSRFKTALFGWLAVIMLPNQAMAAENAINSGDTAWILTATALVLFMTLPGLALFYAGLVQAKNVVSVLMHHFAIAALMSVLWVMAGYSLAFSGDGDWVGDLGKLFMTNVTVDAMHDSIPESVFAAFQMTFAIITPALIIGAYVERMKFAAILIFSALWLLAVYVPITHWVWGGWHHGRMGCDGFCWRDRCACDRRHRGGGLCAGHWQKTGLSALGPAAA